MALISTGPLGTRRKGIGGRLLDSGSTQIQAAPPYRAPAGKRWVSKIVPQYTTRRVRAGWKTVEERVPITRIERVQVGTEVYYSKVPVYRNIRVRDGWDYVRHRVPLYRSRRYVRYYRTSWRRVGWRWVRRRVPVYGTRRVRVGTRVEARRVPSYTTKRVVAGYRRVRKVRPVYEMREKVVGYRTVQKRVPRYVNRRVKIGDQVEWTLVDRPRRTTSSSGGQGGLARVMPQGNGPAVPDEGGSSGNSQSGGFDWGAWKRADMAEVERAIVAGLDPADRKFLPLRTSGGVSTDQATGSHGTLLSVIPQGEAIPSVGNLASDTSWEPGQGPSQSNWGSCVGHGVLTLANGVGTLMVATGVLTHVGLILLGVNVVAQVIQILKDYRDLEMGNIGQEHYNFNRFINVLDAVPGLGVFSGIYGLMNRCHFQWAINYSGSSSD